MTVGIKIAVSFSSFADAHSGCIRLSGLNATELIAVVLVNLDPAIHIRKPASRTLKRGRLLRGAISN